MTVDADPFTGWRRAVEHMLVLVDRLLVSSFGVVIVAFAWLVLLAVTIAMNLLLPIGGSSPGERFAWGIAGVLGAVSMFVLWGGMLRFWFRWDSSGRKLRLLSLLLLIGGAWYGAMVYFVLVYFPTRLQNRAGVELK